MILRRVVLRLCAWRANKIVIQVPMERTLAHTVWMARLEHILLLTVCGRRVRIGWVGLVTCLVWVAFGLDGLAICALVAHLMLVGATRNSLMACQGSLNLLSILALARSDLLSVRILLHLSLGSCLVWVTTLNLQVLIMQQHELLVDHLLQLASRHPLCNQLIL